MSLFVPHRSPLSLALLATLNVLPAWAATTPFNLPAGPLDQTLLQISRQTGLPISFEQKLVSGRYAPAIQGQLEQRQALTLALQDSGLKEQQDTQGVTITADASTASSAATFAEPTTQLQRVEVTGTAIRRVDAETAVPVTVLRVEKLREQGVTTTEELINRISANQSSVGSGRSVGSSSGGAAYADLRGIGPNKTLVLLNGRRLSNNATNAINGSGVDLNTIPFAAIDRVEVLRDGASALYGTDAIGGVINFITKKSLTRGQVSTRYDTPSHSGGGQSKNFSGSWGIGDLEEDRFNVFGVVSYDKQERLAAKDRGYTYNYQPGRGLDYTSGTASPANWSQGANATNPLAGSGCNAPGLLSRNGICRQSLWSYLDLVPETEKTSAFAKATGKLSDDHNVSLEYFWARNENRTQIGPGTLMGNQVNPGTAFYPGNGITPGPSGFALDPTQPVAANWRETDVGARRHEDDNTGQRLLLSFDGSAAGWDYNIGVSYNQNKVVSTIRSGYVNDVAVSQGIANGVINPFGPQTAAGSALLAANTVDGDYATAVGRVKAIDGRVSREIGDWFGSGPSALALGGEYRKEDFHQDFAQFAGNVQSLGIDPNGSVSGDRSVQAQYAELNVPVLDSLELTAAIRHDKYSDFGSTTNPKYSFRFQPFKELVLRGAYSEGFRAPSLYELYNPTFTTFTNANYNDPRLCPGGTPANGGIGNRDCAQQFNRSTGGNTELKPETARNVTFGFVYQPFDRLNAGLDFWWIKLSNQIAEFPESAPFDNPDLYADRLVRKADGSIDHVVTGMANLGKLKTSGVDVSLDYRLPATAWGEFGLGLQGTYVTRYDYQQQLKGEYIDKLGDFRGGDFASAGAVARWRHSLTATWNQGPLGATLTNRYTSGYHDSDRDSHNRVGSYNVWDLAGTYTWRQALGVTLGVKNLFDREPPFSNQTYTFQSGYDPRYSDPFGRTLYTRLSYNF
ncbi:TonB-dependent receptor [Pseudomonas chlororaphis]|uniref:TonB-dependent receptor n=1 Tax=Pseudomonas chlororaphis TaxID=587753 RepID=UPI001231E3CB|nr:TonB-dependent receptor [Pseudomonas chlororaphis]KAA5840990.1 TonB-dependent receptor [Pseudomonas chlororaphis]